ncbi:MAG: hypothetical protein Q9195_008810 [Heterodermia aff. obscurata]
MFPKVDYRNKHQRLQKLRHENTCDWIREAAAFQDWVTAGISTCLRFHGIPGSGKSRSLNADAVLGTITYQLLDQLRPFPENLERKLISINNSESGTLNIDDLSSVVFSASDYLPNLFVVIDGLDECNKDVLQQILDVIKRLATRQSPVIKLFISSRDDIRIVESLKQYPVLQVSAVNLSNDMEIYVKGAVRDRIESGDLIVRSPELEAAIIAELTTKAHGMFLWVTFQLDDLCEASSDAAIRQTLKDLPSGLVETYGRIMSKVKSRADMEISTKVFMWIAAAKRPLQIDELQEAVAFDKNDEFWDSEKVPDSRIIKRSCRNLIVFDDDASVRFAHHTVLQFIVSKSDQLHTNSQNCFDPRMASRLVAGTCIAYLSFSDFETQVTLRPPEMKPRDAGILNKGAMAQVSETLGLGALGSALFNIPYLLRGGNSNVKGSEINHTFLKKPPKREALAPALAEKYRLLTYVVNHWEDHTRSILGEHNEKGDWVPERLLTRDDRLWVSFRNLVMSKVLTFNFRSWGANTGPQNLPFLSLFRWSIQNNHPAFLQLLRDPLRGKELANYFRHEISNGAHLLIEACSRGHESVLLILLLHTDIGRELSAKDGWLLTHAAAHGHDFIVQTLLVRSFERKDLDSSTFQFINAFHAAAEGGHVAILQLLGQRFVGLGNKMGDPDTALSLAATNGHTRAVQTLISMGADVNKIQWLGLNALHIAAVNQDFDMIETIVEAGASLNTTDYYRGEDDIRQRRAALHYASAQGHIEATKLLLDRGASVDIKDFWGSTPLHMAAKTGDMTTIRLLLDAHASLDIQDQSGKTALLVAAEIGHHSVVEILIEAGAWSQAKDYGQNTALLLATKAGHFLVVEGLLKAGASVGAVDSLECSPLHIAAEEGNLTILGALINAQAHVNMVDSIGKTPLLIAVENGNEQIVDALLSAGASTNVRNREGVLPLDLAYNKEYSAIVGMLLRVGAHSVKEARPKLEDAYGLQNRIHEQSEDAERLKTAIRESQRYRVKELLEHGVNPSKDLKEIHKIIQEGDDAWQKKELKNLLETHMTKHSIKREFGELQS